MKVPLLLIWLCCYFTIGSFKNKRSSNIGRIVNGVPVEHDKYPFMVSVQVYVRDLDKWISKCGGSIVNSVTVLTACHCVTSDGAIHGYKKYMQQPGYMRVLAGTGTSFGFISRTQQVSIARRLVTHPTCQNSYELHKSFVNDVALMFLATPLVYNAHVSPIRLPSFNVKRAIGFLENLINRGAKCTIIGWGRTIQTVPGPTQRLMGTTVQLLKPGECRRILCDKVGGYCQIDFEGLGQLCVVSSNSSDCAGDSGGPLICEGFVVGAVSFGYSCEPNLPTVYQGLKPILELLTSYGITAQRSSNSTNSKTRILRRRKRYSQ